MATVDITEKLGLKGCPTIQVGETVLTVDNSARAVLKLMQIVDGENVTPAQVLEAMDVIFAAEDLEKLDSLNLSFNDLTILLQEAMGLVVGAVEGEAETLDTTS